MPIIAIDTLTQDAVLAGLRLYQAFREDQLTIHDPQQADQIREIAGAEHDPDWIEEICEALNTGALDLDFEDAAAAFGMMQTAKEPELQAYIDAAADIHADPECVELDESPFVSPAEDGAWVSAWVWVSDDEAHIQGAID